MLAELKSKSQLTIPSSIVTAMKLKKGDYFDVIMENGRVILIPVVVYPREYVEKLEQEAKKNTNKSKPFSDVDELLDSLEGK